MIETIGIQLYTLREEAEKDFFKTLEDVAALGFQGVEFAGYYGFSAEEIRKKLDSLKLTVIACHTSYEEITANTAEVIQFNLTLGNKFVVCPYSVMRNASEAKSVAEGLLKVADEYEKAGLTLCYHNHDFEFKTVDGIIPMNEFIKETAGKIQLEVDTFWVENAGLKAADFLRKHRDIISLIHLKDGIKGHGEAELTAIGHGEIEIGSVLNAAEEIGLTSVIVENDNPKPNGIENMKISMENLKIKYSMDR